MSRLAQLAEVRRALPIAAGVLLLVAIALPMWRIVMTAPQYPGQELVVELYAYPRLGGDYEEVQTLNRYVGFYFPDPVFVEPNFDVHANAVSVPEWILGPVAIAGVALASLFVAVAPTVRTLKRGLTALLVGTLGVFLATFAIIQWRLYQAGHALDPNAPVVGVEAFTPPLLGSYQVASISGHAWFGPGGYLAGLAVGLLVIAFLSRDSAATLGEIPVRLRRWREGMARRWPSRGEVS